MAFKKGGKPLLLELRSSKWLIAITVYVATFTDGFVYGIIVPVTPFILVNRIGVPEHEVQFWTSVMLAVFGGSSLIVSPFIGWLAGRIPSRQRPFLFGLLLAFIATILYTVGSSPAVLVLGRCIQGCSVSIIFTVGLAHLVDSVGREEVGQWIGFVLSGMNMGVMISPFLGGLVYEKAGYYPVCAMGLGVIAFNFMLRLVIIERKDARKFLDHDQPINTHDTGYGSFAEANGNGTGSFDGERDLESQNNGKADGSSEPESDSQSKLGVSEEDSLLPNSRVTPPSNHPREFSSGLAKYFPVTFLLLRSPRVWTALYGALVHLGIITAFDAVLPRFVHSTFNWGSMGAGLIFLAISLPSLLGGLFGTLSDRVGPRLVALTGFAISIPALGLLTLIGNNNITNIVLLCLFLALIGTGLNMLLAPLASEMSFVVEESEQEFPGTMGSSKAYAQAYSLFNCALAGGQLIGPTLSGIIYQQINWPVTVGVLAIFCASGAIPVALFTNGPLRPDSIKRGT